MDPPKSAVSLLVISLLLMSSMPFGLAEWVAVGVAPAETGIYNIVIEASYEGFTGSFPLELNVNNTQYPSDGLTVEPVYPISRTPPMELAYKIKKNGSTEFNMMYTQLDVYYASGEAVLKSEGTELVQGNDTYWRGTVNVPFEGEYQAVVSVVIEKNGKMYGGEFMTLFKSDTISPDLEITASLDKYVLTPDETFKVNAEVLFEGSPMTDLELLKTNVFGEVKDLIWNDRDRFYTTELTAPDAEGVYQVNVFADGQDYLERMKIYVADVGKQKSARCPLAYEVISGCTDMRDVRKCVYDMKSDIIQIQEAQLVQCFAAVTGDIPINAIICDSTKIGDLDGDEKIDIDDVEVLQNLIIPLSQSQREDYIGCADYDLDEDVDEDDLACITNVVAKKWSGGLHGGICMDLEYDTPLACDTDNSAFIDDKDGEVLDKLISLAKADIKMSKDVLQTCDFNGDGLITDTDKACLAWFTGLDLDDPETLLSAGTTIPASCMNIYKLDSCMGIRGDINGDLRIDQVDEILIMLANKKQISGYKMGCTDVNKDGRITDEDVLCVKSYTSGKKDDYYVCIGCTDETPKDYRFETEICNDGRDNNCDGLTDRTSTTYSGDWCQCNSQTPCFLVKDGDAGASAGVDDGNYLICRKTSWEGGDEAGYSATTGGVGREGFKWYNPADVACNSERECETILCGSSSWKCAVPGGGGNDSWAWNDTLEAETDDKHDDPKTCEDGFDNDCDGEDLDCEEEEDDPLEDWLPIVAGVIGFVLAWEMPVVGGVAGSVIGGLGSVICGAYEQDLCEKTLLGFGIGAAVGGIAGGVATSEGFAAGDWYGPGKWIPV